MADLKTTQQCFQKAVMGHEPAFLDMIDQGGRISPETRLGIYQHAYKARLRDVLAEDYPVMHSMLGDEVFYGLCNEYIDDYPSGHPSLRYFGQYLEKFVSETQPYSSQQIIAEMARFEWGFHDVFDAADQRSVGVEEVMALAPEVWTTLRFSFHPSVHMVAYAWNVAAVWSSVNEDADSPTLPEMMPDTSYVIQWRHDLLSYFRTLDPDEGVALSLAIAGKAFPKICESLLVEYGDKAPIRAAELLNKWVADGMITALDHMDLGD